MNQQLEDALRGWRIARAKDDELSYFVAGEAMAEVIEAELVESPWGRSLPMSTTFRACGLSINADEIRLWIGDTDGAESVLSDIQIDAFIQALQLMKQIRGFDCDLTWVVPQGDDLR